MNRSRSSRKRLIESYVFCLLALQIGVLAYFNIAKGAEILDYDSAMQVRHVLEMWENKTVFLDNWNYVSTLEIDTAAFFAMPVYFLTSNLSFSLGICNTIVVILYVWVIVDLYRNVGREFWEGCLAAMLVITPYSIAPLKNNLTYSNMLFVGGGQYAFRVLVVLLLLDLLSCKRKRHKKIILLAAYTFLLFWVSLSSGNYVLFMGILPVCGVFVLEQVFVDKINKREAGVLLFSIVIAIIATQLKAGSVAGLSPRNNLNLIKADDLISNMEDCFTGIFLLINGLPLSGNMSVFNVEGIVFVVKICFVIMCISIPIIAYVKCRSVYKYKLVRCAAFIMAVNLFVLMISNAKYGSAIFEERYHLLWFVMILVCIPLFIMALLDLMNNKRFYHCTMIVFLGCVTLVNLSGFEKCLSWENPRYEKAEAIIRQAADLNVDTVYMKDIVTANIVRALEDEIDCFAISKAGEGYVLRLEDYYNNAGGQLNERAENMLVMAEKSFDELPEQIKQAYKKVGEYGSSNMYYSDFNVWNW